MSNRDCAFTALGRFMVVERYRETCEPSSTNRPARPHTDRTGRLAGNADVTSRPGTPAWPQHR
jgi:hypothetical protein